MTTKTPVQFSSPDDALLVLEHTNDPIARAAAWQYLESMLPPHLKIEMRRRAAEIMGIDKLTPVGFNAAGEALYALADLATLHNIPMDEAVVFHRGLMEHVHPDVDCVPVDHPTLKPLGTGGIRKGRYRKTEPANGKGEPRYELDHRGVMQMVAFTIHDNGVGNNHRAVSCLNAYCAMAHQRGCPSNITDRLRQAAEREGGKENFLKWLDRAARFLPEEDFVSSYFRGIVM